MLAFFDRDITRTHFPNAAAGLNQARLLRHLARFAVVQNQKIDIGQKRIQIFSRGLNPEIHRVGHDKARLLHLFEDVGLQRRRDVREQREIGLAIRLRQRRLKIFEHVERDRARLTRVQVPSVFARPAKSFSFDALHAFSVDLLILNDSEAREMTKETSLIKAGRGIRKMGPRYVAIKKGEHGALLFGENEFFSAGAYPLEDIHDPTGAGDTFAGGMAGFLAGTVGGKITFTDLRKAMIYGSVLASFCVEGFSLERLRDLTMDQINERYETFKLMSQFEIAE